MKKIISIVTCILINTSVFANQDNVTLSVDTGTHSGINMDFAITDNWSLEVGGGTGMYLKKNSNQTFKGQEFEYLDHDKVNYYVNNPIVLSVLSSGIFSDDITDSLEKSNIFYINLGAQYKNVLFGGLLGQDDYSVSFAEKKALMFGGYIGYRLDNGFGVKLGITTSSTNLIKENSEMRNGQYLRLIYNDYPDYITNITIPIGATDYNESVNNTNVFFQVSYKF